MGRFLILVLAALVSVVASNQLAAQQFEVTRRYAMETN